MCYNRKNVALFFLYSMTNEKMGDRKRNPVMRTPHGEGRTELIENMDDAWGSVMQ